MRVQPLVAQPPVERFDVRVIGWFARPGEIDPRAVHISPHVQRAPHELRAVVTEDRLSQAAQCCHELEPHNGVFTLQATPCALKPCPKDAGVGQIYFGDSLSR